MKCLHICNDFLGSKVYSHLYQQLDRRGISQVVFAPLRPNTTKLKKNISFITPESEIHYSDILKKYHRLLFRSKVNFLFENLIKTCDLSTTNVVHATTMYSDGALALRVKENYGIPYIVTVRSTDIGAFNSYRPDLFMLGLEILRNASKIIFISHALKTTFYNHYFYRKFRKELLTKSKVIPNGIDEYWIDHLYGQKKEFPNKIIYVGTFLQRKNVMHLIEATLRLRKKYPKLELNIVGGGGEQEGQIKHLARQHPKTIKFIGKINEKQSLLEKYRANHIFAMASKTETFGLVYLEALSQGLPIVFTKNDGIDGTFNFKVGEPVDPESIDSIVEGLEKTLINYATYELNRIDFSKFSWRTISDTYQNLYEFIRKPNM